MNDVEENRRVKRIHQPKPGVEDGKKEHNGHRGVHGRRGVKRDVDGKVAGGGCTLCCTDGAAVL